MKYFLLLFILMGCLESKHHPWDIFKAKNTIQWSSVFYIDDLNEAYFNTGNSISSPARTWQLLVRLSSLKRGSFKKNIECVFYKVPLNSEKEKLPGILKVIELKASESCSGQFIRETDNQIEGIEELKVSLNTELSNKTGLRRKRKVSPFTLSFQISGSEKKINLVVPLTNYTDGKRNTIRYQSGFIKRRIPGMLVGSLDMKSIRPPEFSKQSFFGLFEDNLKDRSLKICHDINEKCQEVKAFTCDRCAWGWFEAVGSGCAKEGRKYCGVSRCGELGEPACPRGNKGFQGGQKEQCFKGSPYGFCSEGLIAHCVEGLLVCL